MIYSQKKLIQDFSCCRIYMATLSSRNNNIAGQ
jgi:hypothetical protein